MRRTIHTLPLTLFFFLVLSISGFAAFTPSREYTGFSDVSNSHWSQPYIQRCYELRLMSGTGGDTYSPSGSVSVAQGIMISVRLKDLESGGDGVIDQSGSTWYEKAVQTAIAEGLITKDQFDSYTRPATRAELAGLLANALPARHYKAINSVSVLPDVDAATPFSREIFRLYNAGILSGSDVYGTFSPDAAITRAEIPAILCRLMEPSTRLTLKLLPKPADLTVYSTDKLLYVSGVPAAGVVRIDGEYYFPMDLLDSYVCPVSDLMSCSYGDGYYYAYPQTYCYNSSLSYYPITTRPVAGRSMGTADAIPHDLDRSGDIVEGAVYTIGGYYPMVKLSALGAVVKSGDFHINALDKPIPLKEEADLIGAVLPSLQRSTTQETLLAIHDYIVNLMTHTDALDTRYMSEAAISAAWGSYEKASAAYNIQTNVSLACGYGVCQDYADLFLMMCSRIGVPCTMVSGANHAWNRVYLNGKWQFVDCTWDDPVSSKPRLDHDYFLVDAERMVRDHYWADDDYPMPKTYDPAWEQLDPNNITSADMFRKCLVAQVAKAPYGTSTITLRTIRSGSYGGYHCIFAYPESDFWSIYGGHKGGGVYVYTLVR